MSTLDFGNALLGAVAGLALQGIVRGVVILRQLRRYELSGKMYQIVPPSGGKSERWDIYTIRQRGQTLRASAKRIRPAEEASMRWKMTGYTHGNTIVFSFYPANAKQDPASYGAAVLHRNPDIHECAVWQGYYARPGLYGLEAITNANIARYPLVWQRVKPEVRNYAHLLGLVNPDPQQKLK